MTSLAVSTYTASRALLGVVSVLAPTAASKFFGIDINYDSRTLSRLFGVREIGLAAALYWAMQGDSQNKEHPNLRNVLTICLAVDILDAASSALGILEGSMSARAALLVGGGAIVFAGAGGYLINLLR